MSARLFAAIAAGDVTHARLDADGVRHLRALRLARGDVVHAIVGPGDVRVATIATIEPTRAVLRLGDRVPERGADPSDPVFLAIALGDLARMDLVVEKATELGATEVRPFIAARSQLRAVTAARLARWRRIARSACEQCGRTMPPTIVDAVDLPGLIACIPSNAAVAVLLPPEPCAEERASSMAKPARGGARVLIVGPEGGLTADEVALLVRHGAATLTLGPRVLRFETAALAGLVAVSLAPRNRTDG